MEYEEESITFEAGKTRDRASIAGAAVHPDCIDYTAALT